MMPAPKVYAAISRVSAELAKLGVGKAQVNVDEGYSFRGIDDIYNAVAPLLVRHKLCMLPQVLSHKASEKRLPTGVTLRAVTVKMAFDIICVTDGSQHRIEMFGEALDPGDKATNKAMSAAFKYAAIQAFCIPVVGQAEADSSSPMQASAGAQEPVQGWEQWCADISEMIVGCVSIDAVRRVQETYMASFRALASAHPHLFQKVGATVEQTKKELADATVCAQDQPQDPPRRRKAKLVLTALEA